MAVLKKIKFGTGAATPIAKTLLTAKSGGVISVAAPDGVTNGIDENKDYQYELDVNVDNATIVKSSGSLAVGEVPAAQVSVADSGDKFTASNVEAALSELNDKIAQTGGAAKTYKIVEVAETDAANTSLKEYKVQVAVGSGAFADDTASATIVVPKDQHLKNVELVTEDDQQHTGQFLKYTYVLDTGVESDVYVDVSSFLTQSEFGDGLEVSNAGVVSVKLGQGLEFGGETGEGVKQSIKVKIDPTSETFLTVGANGVKLAGVQDAINAKVAALDKTDDAAVAGQYVAAIEETDGVVAVKTRANVSEAVLNNYSKGTDATAVTANDTVNQAISKLENQVDAAEAAATSGITTAIEALDYTDTAVDGQYVSKVDEADGVVSVTRANVSDAVLTGYAKGSAPASGSEAVAATDDVKGAIAKLEHQVDAAKAAASAAHSVVEEAQGNTHVTVTASQPDANGAITYTIGETNIADADDLAAEITRAQGAESEIASKVGLTGEEGSRTFTPTTNYGGTGASAATSVIDNMQKLDTELKNVNDKLAGIKYNVDGTTLILSGIDKDTSLSA